MSNKNPRGQSRPQDGRRKSVGGLGLNRNTGGCSAGGPGYGKGNGRGNGKNRKG